MRGKCPYLSCPLSNKNMNHNHCNCEHDLKYCSCCDTVYCVKCHKEWKQNFPTYTFTNTGGPWKYVDNFPDYNIPKDNTVYCSNHT